MSEVNVYEQALTAVLNEAKSLGIDINQLVENVNAGIMGNKPYTWVGAENKSGVLDALKKAVNEL
ncbi:hypothetical protein [Porticoccus sp.]